MSSTLKRRKKLLLLTVTCVLAEKHRRRKSRSCWIRWWLERRSTLGFSHALVPDGMKVRVTIGGQESDPFEVLAGVKQGAF